MIPADKINQILQRFEFLEARLAEGGGTEDFVALSREYAELKPVAEQASGTSSPITRLAASSGWLIRIPKMPVLYSS